MLASSRKILSYILSIIVAVTVVFVTVSGVDCLTFGKQNFYVKNFATEKIAAECDRQLTEKYKTLSAKSNIPLDVFDSVKVKFNSEESLIQAADYVFDANDSTLKNGSRFDYFKNTINEYFEANNIDVPEEDIDLVATEAQQIYSDTVGLHNLSFVPQIMRDHASISLKYLSASLVILAVAAYMLALIYKKSAQALSFFSVGVMTGGIASALSAIAMSICNIGIKLDVSPKVWNDAFVHMAKSVLAYRAVLGCVFLIVGIILFVLSQSRINREQMRKDTRFSKIFSKL